MRLAPRVLLGGRSLWGGEGGGGVTWEGGGGEVGGGEGEGDQGRMSGSNGCYDRRDSRRTEGGRERHR